MGGPPGLPGAGPSLGTWIRPPGVYTFVGSPPAEGDALRRARRARSAGAAPGSARGALPAMPGVILRAWTTGSPKPANGEKHQDHQAKATPAATTYSPIRARWACATGGCLVTCRRTTLAAMRRAPAITVTAAATARKRTRRILLVAVAWERTGQRSHRGYRPASQIASCNHYDLSFGASPRDQSGKSGNDRL